MELQRYKKIRRIGDSAGIILNREERDIYNLTIGDLVKISIEKEEQKNDS